VTQKNVAIIPVLARGNAVAADTNAPVGANVKNLVPGDA